ncbi:hypothetical protein PMZ80_000738 [Knufia obscura]|uniref:F-box domain-containing protein n=1 Tax=Knufia obscura TaxID=1635080 RepID=A0ABR0S237_9EURO|nr:hypothetical protein PMZ80_000738 [Knufia obscura]
MHSWAFGPSISQTSSWFKLPDELRIKILDHLYQSIKYNHESMEGVSKYLLSVALVSRRFINRREAVRLLSQHIFWSLERLPGFYTTEQESPIGITRLKPRLDGHVPRSIDTSRHLNIENILVEVGAETVWKEQRKIWHRFQWISRPEEHVKQVLLAPTLSGIQKIIPRLRRIAVKIRRNDLIFNDATITVRDESIVFQLADASFRTKSDIVKYCSRCGRHSAEPKPWTTIEQELAEDNESQDPRVLVHGSLSYHGAEFLRSTKRLLVAAKAHRIEVTLLFTVRLVTFSHCCYASGITASFDLSDKLLQFSLDGQNVSIPQEIPDDFLE